MFHDAARFGFVARLEENWRVIREEMTALSEGEFMPWPERSIYGDEGWRTFGLYAFGQKQRRGCALCPTTAHLVRGIPGMTIVDSCDALDLETATRCSSSRAAS